MLTKLVLVLILLCLHCSALQSQPEDAAYDYYKKEIIKKIDYLPIDVLTQSIHSIEDSMDSMTINPKRLLKWSYLHESMVGLWRKRTRSLSANYLSVDLPDVCKMRRIDFKINTVAQSIVFAFISGGTDSGSIPFNVTINWHELFQDLGIETNQNISTERRSWRPMDAVMLLMVHRNGIGMQILVDHKRVFSAHKIMKYGKAPFLKIYIYQRSPAVLGDNHCLGVDALSFQQKRDWKDIHSKLSGKQSITQTPMHSDQDQLQFDASSDFLTPSLFIA